MEKYKSQRRTEEPGSIIHHHHIMAPSDVLLKTARAYLNAINTIDADGIAAVTADSFYVKLSPASAGIGEKVERAALLERFNGLKNIMSTLNITIKQEWPVNEVALII